MGRRGSAPGSTVSWASKPSRFECARMPTWSCVRGRARVLVRACLRAFSCVCARVLVRACLRVFACVHACELARYAGTLRLFVCGHL